jgi:hypothetical protein
MKPEVFSLVASAWRSCSSVIFFWDRRNWPSRSDGSSEEEPVTRPSRMRSTLVARFRSTRSVPVLAEAANH